MKKIVAVVCTLMVAGCAMTTTKPVAGSETVRLTNSEPQGCKLLGDITGSQKSNLFNATADRETGSRNDLKNQAVAMGGNVVQLLSSHTSQFQLDGTSGADTITLSANVYACAQK